MTTSAIDEMTMSQIVQIKTEEVEGPNGPATAMMIAVNIDGGKSGELFVPEVVAQFKINRTLAPPNTSLLLVTLVGDFSAQQFANCWREAVRRDGVLRAYMSLMTIADVIQGTTAGRQLSKASLL